MFDLIPKIASSNIKDPSLKMLIQDICFNDLKLTQMARKQNLLEISTHFLKKSER